MRYFKFGKGNISGQACVECGANSLAALGAAGAFSTLGAWDKRIAIDADAITAGSCANPAQSPDLITAPATIAGLNNVLQSGGAYPISVALDKPFYRGMRSCGFGVAQNASILRQYLLAVQGAHPLTAIGLIESYPAMSAIEIKRAVLALENTGARLPFLHVDLDLALAQTLGKDVTFDLLDLRNFCEGRAIKFGAILSNAHGAGGRDQEYYNDTMATAQVVSCRQLDPAHGPAAAAAPMPFRRFTLTQARVLPHTFAHRRLSLIFNGRSYRKPVNSRLSLFAKRDRLELGRRSTTRMALVERRRRRLSRLGPAGEFQAIRHRTHGRTSLLLSRAPSIRPGPRHTDPASATTPRATEDTMPPSSPNGVPRPPSSSELAMIWPSSDNVAWPAIAWTVARAIFATFVAGWNN